MVSFLIFDFVIISTRQVHFNRILFYILKSRRDIHKISVGYSNEDIRIFRISCAGFSSPWRLYPIRRKWRYPWDVHRMFSDFWGLFWDIPISRQDILRTSQGYRFAVRANSWSAIHENLRVWKKSIGKYWIQYLPILFFHTGRYQVSRKWLNFKLWVRHIGSVILISEISKQNRYKQCKKPLDTQFYQNWLNIDFRVHHIGLPFWISEIWQ